MVALLYLLYTSPLADILKHHNMCYHLYADDIQMYVSFATNDDNSLYSSITQIENCLSDINLWMTANKLKLNKSKTDLIYLYSRHNLQTSLPSIQFGNDSIIPIEAVRNVGAIFDSTLSMVPQVNPYVKQHPITWETLLVFDIFYLKSQLKYLYMLLSFQNWITVMPFSMVFLNVLSKNCNWFKTRLLDWLPAPGNMTILLLSLYNCTGCLSLNESGLRYFSLLSKLFTRYHLSIYKNSSLNTAHLASSDPLMLCYLNVILAISRPMAQERLEWQHRNYGTSFRGK